VALNASLFAKLESRGLTDEHLALALAACESGLNCAVILCIHQQQFGTVELRLRAPRREAHRLEKALRHLQAHLPA
jgi:hypothetical protein